MHDCENCPVDEVTWLAETSPPSVIVFPVVQRPESVNDDALVNTVGFAGDTRVGGGRAVELFVQKTPVSADWFPERSVCDTAKS